jgi:uncharacterized C2H2 Zn-finger protein
MESEVKKRFPCKDCKKTFSRNNALKRHRQSFAHTTGIPCHQCDKAFSRSDDLSLHLQKVHKLGFKEAGRKSGSLRRKIKRSNWKDAEDNRMAAAIEKALLRPSDESTSTDKVVTTLTVPKDVPFTLSVAPGTIMEDILPNVASDTPDPPGNFLPITFDSNMDDIPSNATSDSVEDQLPVAFTITKSLSLEALNNSPGYGTVLSIQDKANVHSTPSTEQLLEQITSLNLPVLDIREWEKMEKFFEDVSEETTPLAPIENPLDPVGTHHSGQASTDHNIMECAVLPIQPNRSAIEESHTPPHSPTAQPPESSITEEHSPTTTAPVQSPIEPISSSASAEPSNIPATWLQVEELWLNLYVNDETTALTTALDFVRQLSNLPK